MAGKLPAAPMPCPRAAALTLAAAAMLAGAAGCGDPPGDATPPDAGPVTLTLGTSDDGDPGAFVPLVDGGTILVHAGPQGGFHVFLSVRVTGLDPGELARPSIACASQQPSLEPCVDLVVRDPEVVEPLDYFVPLHLGLAPVAGAPGRYQLSPPRLVQLDVGSLAEVAGQVLEVAATVTDRHGKSGTVGVAVRAVGVPLPGLAP